jgi:cyclase
MLAKRIIGVVLTENGKVVRRVQQETKAIIGSPEVTIKYLSDWNCDELMFINLDGEHKKTLDLLCQATAECFIPLTFGGHISSIQMAKDYINNGADKVVLGRYAEKDLCDRIADVCGRQAVVISIDQNHYKRYKEVEGWCGELLLHDIERDGIGQGLNLFKDIEISCPKILMGGVGSYKHIVEGLKYADGVACSNLLHFKELSATFAKNEAKKEGMAIR